MTANHVQIVPDPTFGDMLCEFRECRGMSQVEMGRRAGLTDGHASRLESGTRNPTRETVNALADALGVNTYDRNVLLLCAGFAAPAVQFPDEPVITELAAVLRDREIPEAVREDIRAWVRATVRMAQRAAVAS